MFAREDVVHCFILSGVMYVVTRNGTIWRFEGYNTWYSCAYLPVLV